MSQPKLMGVVNVTPDSFSDGGAYDPVAQVKRLLADGADIIDLGAESTRPNAMPVSAEEEWQRLAPVLSATEGISDAIISIDTRHAETARNALAHGASWINDVTGFKQKEMLDAVRESSCKLVVMHSLTVPADPLVTLPANADVMGYLSDWATDTLNRLKAEAIDAERIILDPGVGFGLSAHQSVTVLSHMYILTKLHDAWLVGHSRKSFMRLFGLDKAQDRDEMTRGFSAVLAEQGVNFLRVHDVAGHRAIWSS